MLTKDQAREIHNDIQAALAAVVQKHNLQTGRSRISYDPTSGVFKLTADFSQKSSTGDVPPQFVRDLQRYGRKYGLTLEHLNRELRPGNIFVGLKGETAIIKRDDKFWKADARTVARELGVSPPGWEAQTLTSKDVGTLDVAALLGAKG